MRRLILETHARARLDHFEVLGLERTATADEVRDAYVRLARVLHPDSWRDSGLDDLREKRQEAFIRVSEACETLRDPGARARYEQAFAPRSLGSAARSSTPRPAASSPGQPTSTLSPSEPASPPKAQAEGSSTAVSSSPQGARAIPADPPAHRIDPRLEPGHVLAVAREHFEEERYWDAIQQLEPVADHATGPVRLEAMLLLAQAYLKNPRWKRRAEGVLQDLLAAEPSHVPALLLLAQIYADGRLVSRARSLYQKVLQLSPDNAEAARGAAALDPDGPAPKANGRGIRRLLGVR